MNTESKWPSEAAYCRSLIESRGDANVSRSQVLSYVALQAADADRLGLAITAGQLGLAAVHLYHAAETARLAARQNPCANITEWPRHVELYWRRAAAAITHPYPTKG